MNHIASIIEKLRVYLRYKFCKHKNKVEIYRNYQEGYVEEKCISCGEYLFSDL